MRSIGIAVRVLLVIALVGLGLPAGVQAQGGDDNDVVVAEWRFGDAVSESGEARDIVHRVFTGLVDAGCGGSRMRGRWLSGWWGE